MPRSEHTICRQNLPCNKHANTSSCNPTVEGPFALDTQLFVQLMSDGDVFDGTLSVHIINQVA